MICSGEASDLRRMVMDSKLRVKETAELLPELRHCSTKSILFCHAVTGQHLTEIAITTGVHCMEGKIGESKAIVGYIMVYLRSSAISVELVSTIFPLFEFLFNFWLSIISTNMACNSSSWTREQDKAFENALAIYCGDSIDRWEKIASMVSGKTIEEIKHHYRILVEDINAIEEGRVPLPQFKDSAGCGGDFGCHGGMPSKSHQERKKGIAWTEEEHRLFLMGLDKLGKGDWRGISRNFVVTRTPTQVASHAQKYFKRLSSVNKERRRASIHDVTTVDGVGSSTPRGPITGKTDAGGSSSKNENPTPLSEPDVRAYVPPTIVESSNTTLIPPVEIPMDVGSPIELLYDVGMPIPNQAYLLPP